MADAVEWSKRVAAWRASGQSANTFAQGRGFAGATLKWWSTRLKREQAEATSTSEVRLARVVRGAAPVAQHGVVVELGGARVLVPPGVDSATLAAVFGALGATS